MSQLQGNVEALERQLKGLQMQRSPAPGKKIPPPPPPKKNRNHPQVVQNIVRANLSSEHSYDSSVPGTNSPLYSNVPPPPPPPHHMYSNISPLQTPPPPSQPTFYSHYDDNDNIDRIISPPSPVSSNYSELTRAMQPSMNNYPTYQNYGDYGSHTSNYESIYEPIEPRAQLNISSRAHSGQQSPANALNVLHMQSNAHAPYKPAGERQNTDKEKEVDALTQLLVQSIGEGAEPNTYGICIRCQRKVQGDDSGCTAMNQVYHVSCFTCVQCDASLQGEPFYAVEGQPYCEQDYLLTLEQCSVCGEPIRDRILRATGKPYHPSCFVCVACGKSLDGIPFTVDAANQIHCIEDFHAKFAPRCCVCELPIMPEEGQEETVRVVALDRSFHVKCYRCEDCGLLLSSEAEGRGCYPLDDHILCKTCNAQRIRRLTNVITTDL